MFNHVMDVRYFPGARPELLFKNALAYAWGLVRLSTCVRFAVHLDDDIRLLAAESGIHNATQSMGWDRAAVTLLLQQPDAYSVGPMMYDSIPLPICNVTPTPLSCQCSAWRDRKHRMGRVEPASMPGAAVRTACTFTLHSRYTGQQNVISLQALVFDLPRTLRLLPLIPTRSHHHIEDLLRNSSQRHGLSQRFAMPRDLGGVLKCICNYTKYSWQRCPPQLCLAA